MYSVPALKSVWLSIENYCEKSKIGNKCDYYSNNEGLQKK